MSTRHPPGINANCVRMVHDEWILMARKLLLPALHRDRHAVRLGDAVRIAGETRVGAAGRSASRGSFRWGRER